MSVNAEQGGSRRQEHALGPVGVWSMDLRNAGRPGVAEAVGELAERGLTTLWIPGLDGRGVFDDAGELLAAAPGTRVVIGVLGIWRQDAATVSAAVQELDLRHGRRTIVGFGVSDRNAAAAAGQTYTSPTRAVADYLDRLDQEEGPVTPERRLLGALGPRMARLGAERTAGIHPFLVSPDHTATMRDSLGPDAVIAPHQAVVFSSDPQQARAAARDNLGMFIGFEAYRNNLRRLGFTDDDLVPGGSDRLIDALVAWGDDDAISRRLHQHLDAGADHVAVQVLPTGSGGNGLLLPDWRRLAGIAADLT